MDKPRNLGPETHDHQLIGGWATLLKNIIVSQWGSKKITTIKPPLQYHPTISSWADFYQIVHSIPINVINHAIPLIMTGGHFFIILPLRTWHTQFQKPKLRVVYYGHYPTTIQWLSNKTIPCWFRLSHELSTISIHHIPLSYFIS